MPKTTPRPPRPRAWFRAVYAVIAALLLLPACSAGDGEHRGITDVIKQAIDDVKRHREQKSGTTASRRDSTPLGTDGRTSFDYAAYQHTLSVTLGLMERY
ncbi:hypothetical protein [Streptosporangium sandarakinum]|uniref:hypothetical protein n=1 Tax=Streptosporangium sandarakinum TaxID=1260955 RepID=UPI003719A158